MQTAASDPCVTATEMNSPRIMGPECKLKLLEEENLHEPGIGQDSYTRKTPKARSMKQLIDRLGFTKIPNSTMQSSRPTRDRGPEHVKNSRLLSRQRIRKTGSRAGISQRLHATHVQWDASSCPQQWAHGSDRSETHCTPPPAQGPPSPLFI